MKSPSFIGTTEAPFFFKRWTEEEISRITITSNKVFEKVLLIEANDKKYNIKKSESFTDSLR